MAPPESAPVYECLHLGEYYNRIAPPSEPEWSLRRFLSLPPEASVVFYPPIAASLRRPACSTSCTSGEG
eukprot:scaffold27162_cov57-Phaeocystis_antarctica.AAC.5